MNISMLVLNPYTNDVRVKKEAESLQRAGHSVTVNALWAPGLEESDSQNGVQIRRIRIYARERRHVPFAAWIELIPKFVTVVSEQDPDVIHAHDLNALIPAVYAVKKIKTKLIYDAHEFETGREGEVGRSKAWKRWFWGWIENKLIQKTNAVITVSPSISQELAKRYQIDAPAVIHNCPILVDIPEKGKIRRIHQIPDDKSIVLFQGGLSAGRGIENLVNAMARIPNAVLVFVGDGPMSSSIIGLASALGISDRVYLTGKVPLVELLAYTRDATIGVCLTENTCLNHYYSLPNKLFDYMMVGVPVLASDFPDMAQVVWTAEAGLVADPGNISEIGVKILNLLSHPDALEKMSVAGRRAAETRYNWEFEEQKLFSIYADLGKV